MASITEEIDVTAGVEAAWAAVRDVAHPDRLFAGVLVDARLEGDVRTVTFADGTVVQERIVDVDDEARRVAYTVIGGRFEHHHSSLVVRGNDDGSSTITWISDVLPHEAAERVGALMVHGATAVRSTLGATWP